MAGDTGAPPRAIPVICDRHKEPMVRDAARQRYYCPHPACWLLIGDEARYYLLQRRPDIPEIRVDELSVTQEEWFRERPDLRGGLLDLGYK